MVGVLLQIWNVLTSCSERILTRTQSRLSGVAPHLESSERNDPSTVLLQRCCSRFGIRSPVAAVWLQIWHILNFCQDSWWFSSLQSLRSQVSGVIQRNHQQVFFLSSHQSGHFWNLITLFHVWFLAHPREANLLDTAVVLRISYPCQACFWTDRYYFLQQNLRRVQQYRCL